MTAKKKVKGKVKEMTVKERKQLAYGLQIRLARKKNDYIKNIMNRGYYTARCNMIADQLNKDKILENIDGCPKSKEYMRAEYGLMKMQAIMSARSAHFLKKDLMKDFKLTEDDITAFEDVYYNGKIIRNEYDEIYKKGKKAEFVKTK